MAAQQVAVLLSWMSCCGSALWRYSTNSPSYRIFSTRTAIMLEYEGTSFSEWSVPETCMVKNKSSPTTELRCPSSGIHKIKPIVTGQDEEERYLFLDNSNTCFLWYYKVIDTPETSQQSSEKQVWLEVPRGSTNLYRRSTNYAVFQPAILQGQILPITYDNSLDAGTQSVIIWIYDPENADSSELQWNAQTPSLNSIMLSKQLATLGQKPVIYTFLKRKMYYSHEKLEDGAWSISVPVVGDDMLKEIKGNQVAFQDCFVANLFFLLAFPMPTVPEVPGFLPISLPPGSQLQSGWDACILSFGVVVGDMETFQTNDSFHTWTRLRVPPDILTDDERHNVSDVTLSHDGIFFLINSVLYVQSSTGFKRLGSKQNLPESGIIGIIARKWCWVNYLLKANTRRSSIALWTRNEFYLGYESLIFVKIIDIKKLQKILKISPAATLTIHNVEYTGHPLEVGLLLNYCVTCTTTKKILLVIYNEDMKQWTLQDFALNVVIDSHIHLRFLYSAMPELILWDKHRIYYSYHNFTKTGVLQTATNFGNLSKLSHESTIHDIFIDYYGNILVIMENNIMFHFKINIRDTVKLHLWINSQTKSLIFLNTSGQMYLVSVFPNGTLVPQDYPLSLEVQSVAFKSNDKCPFVAFHNNIAHIFYMLDKGQNLTIWAQIVYPENIGLYIIMESYGPDILEEKDQIHYEIATGYCTKTRAQLPQASTEGWNESVQLIPKSVKAENHSQKNEIDTITFSQNVDYEAVDNYYELQYKNTGLLLAQIRPSEFSKTCPISPKVFQIAVGCDTSKYIAIKGLNNTSCIQHDFYYIIEKSYLRGRPPKNLRVKYSWKKYGCPLRLDFREKFHPLIQLYNDNGFVEDVEVNFIMWEIHGRDDYSFNITMKESGCLHEAQTWKSMTELNEHLPLEDAWGPENYKHCFSYAIGKPGDLNQPYEIINKSNQNHLVWPRYHTGMYVFQVKILDPNYSFCNLTTIFAIEIYGVIPSPNGYLVASFLFLLMLLFFSILVFSYFHYMRIYKPKYKMEKKQKNN